MTNGFIVHTTTYFDHVLYKRISKTFGILIFLKILVSVPESPFFLKKKSHLSHLCKCLVVQDTIFTEFILLTKKCFPGNLNLVFKLFRFSCEKAVLDPSNYVLILYSSK